MCISSYNRLLPWSSQLFRDLRFFEVSVWSSRARYVLRLFAAHIIDRDPLMYWLKLGPTNMCYLPASLAFNSPFVFKVLYNLFVLCSDLSFFYEFACSFCGSDSAKLRNGFFLFWLIVMCVSVLAHPKPAKRKSPNLSPYAIMYKWDDSFHIWLWIKLLQWPDSNWERWSRSENKREEDLAWDHEGESQ